MTIIIKIIQTYCYQISSFIVNEIAHYGVFDIIVYLQTEWLCAGEQAVLFGRRWNQNSGGILVKSHGKVDGFRP